MFNPIQIAVNVFALALCIISSVFAAAEHQTAPGSEEEQVVELTNRQRMEYGLSALKLNPLLSKTAQSHSDNMAQTDTMAHTLNGSTMTQRVKGAGYQFLAIGENIAFNQSTPAEVVNGWMHSPGHRANILNKDFTEIGVGIAKDTSGDPYYTQDFGRPVSAGPTESATFQITNNSKQTATIIMPNSPSKALLDPGSTDKLSISGTGQLPPIKITIGAAERSLSFEDGGSYLIQDTAKEFEIKSEFEK